jgi:uncharacterized damage-inducible protein DinB
MKIEEVRTLFDYNYWANDRIITASKKISTDQFTAPAAFPYGGLRGTLLHVLDAERTWRMRCQHIADIPDLVESDYPTLDALLQFWRQDEQAMHAFLASLTDNDLATSITYSIGEGKTRSRVLWHILIHVMNHGTQHRSEAAAILTSFDCSPGDIDFTVYLLDQDWHAVQH